MRIKTEWKKAQTYTAKLHKNIFIAWIILCLIPISLNAILLVADRIEAENSKIQVMLSQGGYIEVKLGLSPTSVYPYSYPYSIHAEVSAYTATPEETNSDSCHTADMTWVCPASENIVANNGLPFDTIVEIDGVEYRVADRMNRRYGDAYFDILMNSRAEALKWGRQIKTVVIK